MKQQRSRSKVKAAVVLGAVGTLVLSACGGGTGGGSGTDEAGLPIVTVQVVKDARALPMAEMPWTEDLEAACECSIRWQETASSSWDEQRQATLAAGEVADITIGGFGSGEMNEYSSLFLDLAPELESMPNLSHVFDEVPYSRVISTRDDQIFGAPVIQTGLMARSSSHMFINKQWLDAVGLDAPTTWDELKTVLQAFKTQDPNGNGEADEIPLDFNSPSTDGWGWFQPNVLLGSRGIVVSDGSGSGMYADDGTIKNYFTDPYYKEFVQFMHELWSEGLISNEAFDHDWSQYTATAKGEGSTARVGVTWMWTPSDIFGTELADQYITIPQLKAEEGQSEPTTWFFNGDGLTYSAYRAAVSAKVENKEAALRLVDSMYTPDLSVQMRYGSFGVGVEKTADNTYVVLDPEDSTKNASDWQFTHSLSDGAPGWVMQPGVSLTLPAEHVEVRDVDAVYDDDFANVDFNRDIIFGGGGISYTAEESRTLSLNNTGIVQTAMSSFARWVTGGGVEDEWDAYVADLERNNLEENVRITQEAYDRFVVVMEEHDVDLNAELDDPALDYTDNGDGTATLSR